jgi:hypothetical protein
MKALAGVSVLVAIVLGLPGWAGGKQARAARPLDPVISTLTASSSRLLVHGRVRCTATVKSEVKVGQSVSVTFILRNISGSPATIRLWVFSTGLVLHAADGTTYDSGALLANFPGIPPPFPRKLRPGATWYLGPEDVSVRWSGPLRITPECLGRTLPALPVNVSASEPPTNGNTAIADVVTASGHLLDHCRPQTPGVAVYGQIEPPAGDAPPMNAQCSISITSQGSFSVAQVLVVTPPGPSGVQIYQPYETLWPNGRTLPIASNPPYEAIAWEFVVTEDGATPVAASTQAASKDSTQMASFWGWNGTGFEQDATGTCGGTAYARGGTGPDIEFISACPS